MILACLLPTAHLLAAAAAPSVTSGASAALITAALALATAVFGCVAWTVRWAWKIMKRFIRLLDDFLGEPARDGMEARPGVMARLASAEVLLADVLAETRPNHGGSLRDVVNRVERDVADIKREQATVRADLELVKKQRAGREN